MRTRRTKEQIRKDIYNKDVDAYNFYVVNLDTMKAETGFEFKSDAVDVLNDYDDKKKYKVVSKKSLKSLGIENPNESFKYETGGKIKPFMYKENNSTIFINGTKADVKKMYLDYKNNFLSVRKFAEYYNISETQANSIIESGRKYAKEDGYYADGGGVKINTEVILSENRPNGAEWQGVVKPFMLKSIEENQYAGGFKRYEIDIYDEVDREPTKEEIKKANEFFDKIGGRYAGGGKIKPFMYKENNSTIMINGTKADVKKMYLDYKNNFLSVRKFAEYYNISETQANSIIESGRKYAKEDGYYADGGGVETDINFRNFTINELIKKLPQDVEFMWIVKEKTPNFIRRSDKEFKKISNTEFTITDFGTLELSKGSENLYLDIKVMEVSDDAPEVSYFISLFTKDNHKGLKEFSKALIEKFEMGGGVGKVEHFPLDKEKLNEDAKWYADRIKSGQQTTTIKDIEERIESDKKDLLLLEIGRIKPSKIIGIGYKGNTKKIANTYLLKEIYRQTKTLELLQDNYADGGVTNNYVSRRNLNTITIKKGNQKLTYKISDVLNGAYKLESGAKLEDIAFYVPKRSIVKVQLKTGQDFKPANGYWIKDGAKPINISKFHEGGVMSKLLTRKKDQPKVETTDEDIDLNEDTRIRVRPSTFVRKDKEGDWMMKKNSSKEARSYAGGGKTETPNKKGKGNHKMKATTDLARKIRKDGEKWTDAIKRASLQLK